MTPAPRVVVSMTTFPQATPYAVQAAQSILDGSVLPDKMVCYLNLSEFSSEGIPPSLRRLSDINPVFEIRTCNLNIRSYLKLIPALTDFPESLIVTVDDDILYDRNMLRELLRLHDRFPTAIVAHRVRKIHIDRPYRHWHKYRWYDFLFMKIHKSFRNLQTGVGGVLYPPHSLRGGMLDPALFMQIAPTADDLWFWAVAASNGVPVIPVPYGHSKPRELPKPKDISLATLNYKKGLDRNTDTLNRILRRFPEIREIMNKE